MPFEFFPFPELPEVVLVKPRIFRDERGFFIETFKQSDFAKHGIPATFQQENHSRSLSAGVLRGLHFQKDPMAQGKLVRCLEGEVYDVAIDIRKGSPTYGTWVAATLRAEDATMIWVPEGFAHGFCTLTPRADITYKVTREYSPKDERCIRWDDPSLAIPWPTKEPILSAKDAKGETLETVDNDFRWEAPR